MVIQALIKKFKSSSTRDRLVRFQRESERERDTEEEEEEEEEEREMVFLLVWGT